MALKLKVGKKGGVWENESLKELNLLTKYDKHVLIIFFLSFIICISGMVALVMYGVDIPDSAMIITLPFFILGLVWYNHTKKWGTLIFILAATIALYFYMHGFAFEENFYQQNDFILMFAIDFIFVGSVGVVAFVSALQRLIFYRVVTLVQSMNIKDKMNWEERIIAFFFNVPSDIDTRELTMDYNLKRASVPWSEIRETITMGLMIGMFLWIYISMSPNFGLFNDSAPLYIFAIVLYIPVIVMPWSIFNSLHVRIRTNYRDFSLYEGIKGTIKRMVLPMFAALIYVLLAISDNDPMAVATFIATSIVMIIIVIVFTSGIYYAYFENKLVDDIVAKWKIFRPVELLMTISDDNEKRKEYPGTPKRDLSDFGELVITEE